MNKKEIVEILTNPDYSFSFAVLLVVLLSCALYAGVSVYTKSTVPIIYVENVTFIGVREATGELVFNNGTNFMLLEIPFADEPRIFTNYGKYEITYSKLKYEYRDMWTTIPPTLISAVELLEEEIEN